MTTAKRPTWAQADVSRLAVIFRACETRTETKSTPGQQVAMCSPSTSNDCPPGIRSSELGPDGTMRFSEIYGNIKEYKWKCVKGILVTPIAMEIWNYPQLYDMGISL